MDANRPAPPHGDGAEAPRPHGVAAEPDVVPAPIVLGFGLLLTLMLVAAAVLMVVLFRGLERGATKRDDAAIAAAGFERKENQVPPLPRLQVYGVRHWKDFQAAERERLSSYGWMDRTTGSVHVPIERAMDLIAVRGVGPLPAAPVAMPAPEGTPAEEKKP